MLLFRGSERRLGGGDGRARLLARRRHARRPKLLTLGIFDVICTIPPLSTRLVNGEPENKGEIEMLKAEPWKVALDFKEFAYILKRCVNRQVTQDEQESCGRPA